MREKGENALPLTVSPSVYADSRPFLPSVYADFYRFSPSVYAVFKKNVSL